MTDRPKFGLWDLPGSTQSGLNRVPSKPPPINYKKLAQATGGLGTHRAPKIPLALQRRNGPKRVPASFQMTYQESSSDESDSSSADSVKLTEEDLEEVRRMRRRRMEEKGLPLYQTGGYDEYKSRRERLRSPSPEPIPMYKETPPSRTAQSRFKPKAAYVSSSDSESEDSGKIVKTKKPDLYETMSNKTLEPEAENEKLEIIVTTEAINAPDMNQNYKMLKNKDKDLKPKESSSSNDSKTLVPVNLSQLEEFCAKSEIKSDSETKFECKGSASNFNEKSEEQPISAQISHVESKQGDKLDRIIDSKPESKIKQEVDKESKEKIKIENIGDSGKKPDDKPESNDIKSIMAQYLTPKKESNSRDLIEIDTAKAKLEIESDNHLLSNSSSEIKPKVKTLTPSFQKHKQQNESKSDTCDGNKILKKSEKTLKPEVPVDKLRDQSSLEESLQIHAVDKNFPDTKDISESLTFQAERKPETSLKSAVKASNPANNSEIVSSLPVKSFVIESEPIEILNDRTSLKPNIVESNDKVFNALDGEEFSEKSSAETEVKCLKPDEDTCTFVVTQEDQAENFDLKALSKSARLSPDLPAPISKKKKKEKIELPNETDFDPFEEKEAIFEFKNFEFVFMWEWDVQNETCAICRSSLMEVSPTNPDEKFANQSVVIWGTCGHAFHNSCMALWTKNNPRCPLCQQDWVVSRIGQ